MGRILDRVGWSVAVVGVVVVLSGALPADRAHAVWVTVWPVLLFLLLIKMAADLLDRAGVFATAGREVARLGGGSRVRAFLAFLVLCLVVTTFLSIDTTVVLLTPAGLALARITGSSRMTYALATLWVANVGSLLLPVANLTNLLAVQQLHLSAAPFLRRMWWPQVVALAVVVVVLLVRHRRRLRGSYARVAAFTVTRPTALGLVVVALLAVAVTAGAAPWLVAAAALVVLLVGLPLVGCSVDVPRLVRAGPWSMVGLALGLFWVFAALEPWLVSTFGDLVGGSGAVAGVRRGLLAAAAANVGNNLPAYVAVEPLAHSSRGLLQLLVGVNVGPLVTPWGSLATLLWWQVCHEQGFHVRLRPVLAAGALVALVAVPLATLPL